MVVKVLEKTRVSPPPGSVANTTLPLTFFDLIWLPMPPVQRLFFYQFPDSNTSTAHFVDSILPRLKHTLSLALQLFYPFAGAVSLSPESGEHEIRYLDGDSVSFTVAESDSDFHLLASNGPVDVKQSHLLVPDLPPSDSDLLSLKVTVFRNVGVCIGISVHHVAADGSCSVHFMKSWASICRTGLVSSVTSLPDYNRAAIQDGRGLKKIFLDQIRGFKNRDSLESIRVGDRPDSVRATFVLSRSHIEKLKQRVAAALEQENGQKSFHCSAFVVTWAHVWACTVAARGDDPNRPSRFGFAVDCRSRLEYPISETYFGNCIWLCLTEAMAEELGRINGLVAGAESIGKAIAGLEDGVLNGAETHFSRAGSLTKDPFISVAGSPKFRVYDTDFGWGRPRRVEISSIESTGAISLAESRYGDGGLEVGLILPKSQMDRFDFLFNEGLAPEP